MYKYNVIIIHYNKKRTIFESWISLPSTWTEINVEIGSSIEYVSNPCYLSPCPVNWSTQLTWNPNYTRPTWINQSQKSIDWFGPIRDEVNEGSPKPMLCAISQCLWGFYTCQFHPEWEMDFFWNNLRFYCGWLILLLNNTPIYKTWSYRFGCIILIHAFLSEVFNSG